MNSVVLIGRLTRDPELRYTTSEMAVCNFTLAVDRMKKDAGADFIRCIAFGKTAETISKYMTKGRQMAVHGHIQTDTYEKDGQKRYTFEVIADRFEFIGSKDEPKREPEQTQLSAEVLNGFESIDESDIPF